MAAIWQEVARVAITSSLAAYTNTGGVLTATGNGALAAQDGVSLAAGDLVLLTAGAAAADNGLYRVTSLGGASAPYVLTLDSAYVQQVQSGMAIFVSGAGTANPNTMWVLTTSGAIVAGTTGVTFSSPLPIAVSFNIGALSAVVTGAVVARFKPTAPGMVLPMSLMAGATPPTTGAKAFTLTAAISGTSVSGGAVVATTSALLTYGNAIYGGTISGLNVFAAGQEITVVASAVTAATEGQAVLQMFLQPIT